jgi:hypothetical protein
MDNTNFIFKILNLRTNEIKSFVTKTRSMNEAISDAYIKTHTLRTHPKDSWKIVSAIDESFRLTQ